MDWTNVRSASSPSRMWRFSSRRLAGVRSLPPFVQLGARLVAPLDGLRQAHLVIFGEQWVLPDVGEVQANEVFFVSLYSLLGQLINPSSCSEVGSMPTPERQCDVPAWGCVLRVLLSSSGSSEFTDTRVSRRVDGHSGVCTQTMRPATIFATIGLEILPDSVALEVDEPVIVTMRWERVTDDLLAEIVRYVVMSRGEPGCRNIDLCASVTDRRAGRGHREVGLDRRPSGPTSTARPWWPWPPPPGSSGAARPELDLLEGISAHDLT